MNWLPIKGFENHYSASDAGFIRNDRTGKILKPMMQGEKRKQYQVVALCVNGQQTRRKVHQIILETFDRPGTPNEVGRHRDDDTSNNAITNLCWGSRGDNNLDMVRLGNHPVQVLTNEQAAEIRTRRLGGERGAQLAREFGVSPQTICDIANGRRKGMEA